MRHRQTFPRLVIRLPRPAGLLRRFRRGAGSSIRPLWLATRLSLIFALLGLLVLAHAAFISIHPYHVAAERYDITEVVRQRTGCVVVDSLGQSLGRIFATNIAPVSIDALPPHLVEALIATEDAKFFRHGGADLLAIVRATRANLRDSRIGQGASTITQQLARSIYQIDERSFERKLLELFLARRIERHYSKQEILEQYLNRIYFGNGCWGIGAAAREFFGKSVQELSLEESALLAGIIKRPVGFSPYLYPDAALATRNRTLQRMEKLGFLTPADSLHFQSTPLRLLPRSVQNQAPHYLLQHIEHETRLILQERNLPVDGFVVHTSADPLLQAQIHDEIIDALPRIEALLPSSLPSSQHALTDPGPLQLAVVVIHNRTGRILASVGGRSFEHSQFNRAFQSRRPAGSAFLPFVYAAVFNRPEMGPRTLTLDTALDNRKVMMGGRSGVLGEWATERFETHYEGEIPAAYAFLQSKNAATVRLGSQVGLDTVCSLAREAGIESPLRRYPSTFLGASEVSLLELTRAYTVFPNQGLKPPRASLVDYISKPDGTLVYQRPHHQEIRLLSPATSGQVTRILQEGLHRAPSHDVPGLCSPDAAGKSGTVYDFTDAWFVGFNSAITCGVWTGFDQPSPLSPSAFGRKFALPLWTGVMNLLGPAPPIPPAETFDAHGPLFCSFPHPSPHPSSCSCILHHPETSPPLVLQSGSTRPIPGSPPPVRSLAPIVSGEDPYGASWPSP